MTGWANKTVFITGGSRGIGREIILKLAHEGANITIAAKSDIPNPKLPGTIHSVAQEIVQAGGHALPIATDARDEAQLKKAIEATVEKFGGIDLLINNAGFLGVTPLAATDTKKFDLMHALNTRAPLITMRECLPHLQASKGSVLNLCPPLNMDEGWLGAFIPYTTTKYAMTLLSMGFQQEVKNRGIVVKTLWPATLIATAAVGMFSGEEGLNVSRKPAIMADAAFELVNNPTRFASKVSWLDEEVLRETGVTDFAHYANNPERAADIQRDFYIGLFSS
ncbi:MAG: SDR family oxidoreductase [Gammaproteobacteria bacterium]|nr:SDR family oxidoreductase [Gammaproteobacteria bacterium]MBU0849365.1 SDR family oxidoreductase [Gammaproteobacteria bacterium]MBU1266516.1 SDR family oxidoreductase [Gammaproteobacteria bacterium]MBU1527711.1 SDR family oxidoreductase [Gammaproteobacteria bacterium]MBU1779614.1 SDR family oxidoreductase [Gammaproteobacteria bacterium]